MRPSAILVLVLLSSAVRAGEPSADSLIEDLKKNYERMLADFKGVRDQATAEAARKRLDKLIEEREAVMRSFGGLKLKPIDRDNAQTKLNGALAQVSIELQKEVARVSLAPAALAKVEDLSVVKEMTALIENRAKSSLNALDKALKSAAIKNDGNYPKSLNEVARYLADKAILRDPWGREWQYDVAGKRNKGKQPYVWTTSPFGGGKKVIGNWSDKK